jgi:polar amino acid transport system substrate-binding protein
MSTVSSLPGMASFRLAAAAFLIASVGLAAKPGPVLTYSTNPSYPPYDWAEDEASFRGASTELLSMLLPPGVQARPVVVPWKRALALAAEHKVDLILSVRDTPEWRRFLEFMSNQAFPNPIAVFVRRDHAFPFRTWQDLKGKHGGVSLGDTFGGGFDAYWHEQERRLKELNRKGIPMGLLRKYLAIYAHRSPTPKP